jgi:hypothetical protein
MKNGFCEQPDRDEPRIKCGYPIPCPFHTVLIDDGKIKSPIELDKSAEDHLKRVAEFFRQK